MPILSPKRQITIPKELCDRLHVRPGDELDMLEHEGRITILKKQKGASAGILKHLKADSRYTEKQSLDSSISKRRKPNKKKRQAA